MMRAIVDEAARQAAWFLLRLIGGAAVTGAGHEKVSHEFQSHVRREAAQ